MVKKKPTSIKLAGQDLGTMLSSLPLIGKPLQSFGTGIKKGISALMDVEQDPNRKYYVSIFRDPDFRRQLKEKGLSKKTPLQSAGAYDPTNIAELGRPKGFKQNNPKEDDKTKTANPSTELFQRFVQGRTGRPLAYADAQKEIPDLTKRRYANYLNFLYNNPDPLGKATGGFIKTTRENLEGNPEARFLGYPVSIPAVTSAIGGIAGARLGLKTSPRAKEVTTEVSTEGTKTTLVGPRFGEKGYKRFIGRGLVGGVAGAVPGVLAGKLINKALARSENDKQPPMHPYQ